VKSPLVGARQREKSMRNETLLKISAVVFAVLWTLLMWWSRGPMDETPLAILIVSGALAGGLWYWLYGKWFRWYIERR
jgi:uncharacterized membrane protein